VLRKSIGFRVTVGVTLTLLAASLAVGWQLLVVGDLRPVARELGTVHWVLLILGTTFFVLLIAGLVLLCIWLVREMRVNQRQQAFLDAVTHELKTPLASLRLFVDTLGRHDPAPERRREFLAHMGEDLDRLDRTVDQVLAAARAEVKPRSSRALRTELPDLLSSCIEEIRSRHNLSQESLRLHAREGVQVRGDAAELGLVFRNLLENAVKYSQGPVDVQVAVSEPQEGRVSVEIADRGIGIPRRELRRIFERFYRTGRDVQRQVAGLGLGLFIVRSLVRRQGGRVVARSEGAGRGSRFVVTLRTAPAGAGEEA